MIDNPVATLSRLLLPVKDFTSFSRTLPLIRLVASIMAKELEKLDLIHVVGGSFLSTHLSNIDFRAGRVLSSDLMQRLRQQHYEDFVAPLLSKAQEVLQNSGAELEVAVRVEDGDPAKKISSICEDEDYSTLIMARQKEEDTGLLTGTVLTGVLHRFLGATIYIIGEDGFSGDQSPASRLVVGIDGSQAGFRAVREAALVASRAGEKVEQVALVYVTDPACLIDEGGLDCQKASELGYQYLKEAEDVMATEGCDKTKIMSTVLYGKPGETLTDYARSMDATMCYIGRRDRSNIAKVLLGSVCGDVIHRCRKITLVLVS